MSATTQQTSCYRPEIAYFGQLPAEDGYPGGGGTACPPAVPTTGEDLGPYDTQDPGGASNPDLIVKDHSESDIRVDPNDPKHLIGQSKWFVNAEGYNHLLGFYESRDGGQTWPTQGHVPGYEGWTDNTDPVGAFDPWSNFYSLVLGYNFYYDKDGGHKYDNGSKQTNALVPPEVVAVSVRPHGATGAERVDHEAQREAGLCDDGQERQHVRPGQAVDRDRHEPRQSLLPDGVRDVHGIRLQPVLCLRLDRSRERGRDPHATGRRRGTLPTPNGKPWDSYLLPHVAPDGTVYTTVTNGPPKQGFSSSDVDLIYSADCGATWQGPLPVVQGISVPTYKNTTFREGIVNTFAVGGTAAARASIRSTSPTRTARQASRTSGSPPHTTRARPGRRRSSSTTTARPSTSSSRTWRSTAASGKVAVAFYDRRLECPQAGTADALRAGLQWDPGRPYGASNYCVNTAVQYYDAQLHRTRPQPARLGAHLGPATKRSTPRMHLLDDDVHRRLLRHRLRRHRDVHDLSIHLQPHRRKPHQLPATDRRPHPDPVAHQAAGSATRQAEPARIGSSRSNVSETSDRRAAIRARGTTEPSTALATQCPEPTND